MTRNSKPLLRTFVMVALAMVTLSGGLRAAIRTFALPKYLANPGATVEVPITLNNASSLAAIRVQINFDPEVLELQSVSAGPLGNAFELNRGKGVGFVQLLLVRPGSLAGGSGCLAVLKFRANPGAKAKVYSDLAIADIGLSDSSGVIDLRQKDSLRLFNGRITVSLSPDIHNPVSTVAEWWTELQPLSGLALSNGNLNPSYSPAIFNYTTSVANTVTSIKVTPTLADPNAIVKVNGMPVNSKSPSAAIPLAVGTNTITTRVTSQNGTNVKTYTIKVTRAKSQVATLSSLVVNTATLSPGFNPSTINYSTSVPFSTNSIKINATTTHDSAKIKINEIAVKSGTLSAAISLKTGTNLIKIVVTAQNGTNIKTYKITVTRASQAVSIRPDSLVAAFLEPAPENPSVSGFSSVSKVIFEGEKYLQLTLRRNLETPKPVIEVSPNLVDWFSGDRHTTVLVDDGEVLQVRDNIPITPQAKRFIRTKAVPEK